MAESTSKECCSICLDVCTNPVTLPCKHEFCAGCRNGWRCRFTAESLEKRKCPVCRSDLPPTREMFDQLRFYRADLARAEASGESSQFVAKQREFVQDLESFLEPWDEEELSQQNAAAGDRGGDPVEMPMRVATAATRVENIGKVLDWTGHPPRYRPRTAERRVRRHPGYLPAPRRDSGQQRPDERPPPVRAEREFRQHHWIHGIPAEAVWLSRRAVRTGVGHDDLPSDVGVGEDRPRGPFCCVLTSSLTTSLSPLVIVASKTNRAWITTLVRRTGSSWPTARWRRGSPSSPT